jgi:hypothetical protein
MSVQQLDATERERERENWLTIVCDVVRNKNIKHLLRIRGHSSHNNQLGKHPGCNLRAFTSSRLLRRISLIGGPLYEEPRALQWAQWLRSRGRRRVWAMGWDRGGGGVAMVACGQAAVARQDGLRGGQYRRIEAVRPKPQQQQGLCHTSIELDLQHCHSKHRN